MQRPAEQAATLPLSLSNDRVWLYGSFLIVFGLLPLLLFPNAHGNRWRWATLWAGNWAYFVGGGATVGTPDLVGPRHISWELAHGFFIALPWAYPPAFAWFFAPFARIPLSWGFWINAILMLGACVASGLIAANIYGLPKSLSVLALLAWEGSIASVADGQNASVALLLSMLCILGLVRGKPIVAGVAVGLLLFKPTDAAVFVLLLLLRRQWRALALVAGAGIVWYLASVPAAAGDWLWPYHYAASMLAYYPHQDFAKGVISISGLTMRLGLPRLIANGICAVVILLWCIIAVRVPLLEAASLAGLVVVATSPHANPYEAALLAPAIFFVITNVAEPWRTRIIVTAYVISGISIMRWFVSFDPVTILVVVSMLGYLAFRFAFPPAWPSRHSGTQPAPDARAKRPFTA